MPFPIMANPPGPPPLISIPGPPVRPVVRRLRPVLRPLPPTRYYPNSPGAVRYSGGASYVAGMDYPISGNPWNRY